MKIKKKKIKSYQKGGQNPPIYTSESKPTTKDSLDLYNNSLQVLNYYRKRKYKEDNPVYGEQKYFKSYAEDDLGLFEDFNREKTITYPNSKGSHSTGSIPLALYHQNIDTNKYKQRESANLILDTRAPMPLYDRRIVPTARYTFTNTDIDDPLSGDYVQISGYDPIAVKPSHMKTKQDWEILEKRYGTKQPVQPVIYKPEDKWRKEYNEKHPPIYLNNSKDPRIGQYNKEGNQYLYSKPKEQPLTPIKQKPLELLSTSTPQDIVDLNLTTQGVGPQLEPGTYFTRKRQSQEEGQGKYDYFDKKTGKLITTFKNGGTTNPLEGDLISKVLMERNRDKKFVQRAFNPQDYPMQYNPDGTVSTHLMAWGTDDEGQAWMYPTIFNPENEAIKVPNQYADYISSTGYKNVTNVKEENDIEMKKSGGKIHIKKANVGKFTTSAKKAGQSVQEHAHSVMKDPNATPLQKKRANFAIQAKKWHKKADGGIQQSRQEFAENTNFGIISPSQGVNPNHPNWWLTSPGAAWGQFTSKTDPVQMAKNKLKIMNDPGSNVFGVATGAAATGVAFKMGGKLKKYYAEDGLELPEQQSMFGSNGLLYDNSVMETPYYTQAPEVYNINMPEYQYMQNPQVTPGLADEQNSPDNKLPPNKNSQPQGKQQSKPTPMIGPTNNYFLKAANMATVGGAAANTNSVLNLSKGIFDVIGSVKQNKYIKSYERDRLFNQKEGATKDPFSTYYTDDVYGQSKNPLIFEYGGVNQFKTPRDMSNSELENLEVIQTPEGLSGTVNGNTHASGGIPMNLPPETKIFSEKLKIDLGGKKKSFAKIAKKYSTEKDFKNLDSKFSDKVNRETSEMNIQMKTNKLDELFNVQEAMKLSGEFGTKVAKDTREQMENGGILKYPNGGKKGKRLAGTSNIGEDNFKGDLNAVYQNAKILGYTGPKDISSLQKWQSTQDPRLISDYMLRVKPNNKAIEYWKENYSSTEPIDMMKMTPEERVMVFNDNLWDYRFPKSSPIPYSGIPTELSASTPHLSNNFNYTSPYSGNVNNASQIEFIPLPMPRIYDREPLHTSQLRPNLINYRSPDIEPQLNEINRTTRSLSRYLPTTPTGVSQRAQFQGNALNAINQAFGNYFNTVQQGKIGVDQFNAQARGNVDQINLSERNRFLDQIQRREGNIDTFKRADRERDLQNYYNANQYPNSANYINQTFNPSANYQGNIPLAGISNFNPLIPTDDQTITVTYDKNGNIVNKKVTQKKWGGKIKPKLGKKK